MQNKRNKSNIVKNAVKINDVQSKPNNKLKKDNNTLVSLKVINFHIY